MKVRDSNGIRIGFFQVSTIAMDDELADALKAWQTRHSHRTLSLMPPSVSAG
jgi:hypothetical protein